ncbi:MAG: 3-hydroxyacyl-ACP dehydratase FabZ [Oscillospiraceae bacterium]
MELEEIKKILPHRDAMLLIEKVELTEGAVAKGQYTVRGDEWFLQGHFPGNPVVPGVILCEIMAQTCCVLLSKNMSPGNHTPYFTSLDKVKFRRPVKPGDIFETSCKIVRSKGPFYFAEGTGSVEGQQAVSASFSFALVENK